MSERPFELGQPAYSFEQQQPFRNLLDEPVMRSLLPNAHGGTTALQTNSLFGSNELSQRMGSMDPFGYQQSNQPKIDGAATTGEAKQNSLSGGFYNFSQQAGGGFETFSSKTVALTEPFLEPNQLEPVPVYYERYSSFYTTSRPETLLRDIQRIFNAMEGVDHDLKPSKCKINGYANGVSGRCAFKVQLFWHQGTVVLCEFQRRSGCVVSFNKFWKKSLGSLKAHAPALPESCVLSLSENIDCSTLPAAFAETYRTIWDRDTLDRLLAMAACENVDVQREGSAALAAISLSNAEQLSCALPQLMQVLRKLMLANDEELCRNACVVLGNLCVAEACRVEVVKSLLTDMLNLLKEPSHMGRRDSKRHVARALYECSKTPGGVKALYPHASIFQGYRDIQDSALQGSIRGTLAHLKVC